MHSGKRPLLLILGRVGRLTEVRAEQRVVPEGKVLWRQNRSSILADDDVYGFFAKRICPCVLREKAARRGKTHVQFGRRTEAAPPGAPLRPDKSFVLRYGRCRTVC